MTTAAETSSEGPSQRPCARKWLPPCPPPPFPPPHAGEGRERAGESREEGQCRASGRGPLSPDDRTDVGTAARHVEEHFLQRIASLALRNLRRRPVVLNSSLLQDN